VWLELLYPGRCLLCGNELSLAALAGAGREPVCGACRDRLGQLAPLAAANRCRVCSLPLISEQDRCTRCREREYDFGRNVSACEYRGPVKELLFQYKFRNRRRLAPLLADLLAPLLQMEYPGRLLVPAPANPHGVRRRGWDPVELLARSLQDRHGAQILRCLRRRAGAPQKSLSYEERLENLHRQVWPLAGRVPARPLVLLDDVFTTGATANECARALLGGGALAVDILTLAIDVP